MYTILRIFIIQVIILINFMSKVVRVSIYTTDGFSNVSMKTPFNEIFYVFLFCWTMVLVFREGDKNSVAVLLWRTPRHVHYVFIARVGMR